MPSNTNKATKRLSDLPLGALAQVSHVDDRAPVDLIAARLRDLGFVRGEPVRIVAAGPIGGDPVLVQVGFTRFALRHGEASRVMVDPAAVS
ncbi:MAG: ferrous iron transport protein A [Betaproteobacteria bacterium]|nr:MAG: ferrous iron transport protein A [Betaproteobacteria bacterium]